MNIKCVLKFDLSTQPLSHVYLVVVHVIPIIVIPVIFLIALTFVIVLIFAHIFITFVICTLLSLV